MRNFIIDTDTASDDAVAIVMALRAKDVRVLGITTVAGNVDIENATRNARISVEHAGTYAPPIYQGLAAPLFRPRFLDTVVDGDDGLGGNEFEDPKLPVEKKHAVNAIIDLVAENEDVELIALGPMSNIALAFLKAPETMKKVKRIVAMGGQGFGFGNIEPSPMAEFNIYQDAEACKAVLEAGIPITFVGWDACLGDAILSSAELDALEKVGPIGKFCVDTQRGIREFCKEKFGERCSPLADPAAIAVALDMSCGKRIVPAYACVETRSEETYGEIVIDHVGIMGQPFNAEFVVEMNAAKFKDLIKSSME